MNIGALKWMKEKGFISEEECENTIKYIMERKKHKASGDPDPGAVEAAAPAENDAAPARPKINKEDEAWVRANVLPKVQGCTITHDVTADPRRWYAKYPN